MNVEAQRRDPHSLLRWLMRMIRVRNSLVCVHNLDERPHEVSLTVPDERGGVLANFIESDESVAESGAAHVLMLEPYGYRWYRVGGFDYALRRG